MQGQYWDEESGLHYNRHRYYDPNSGRFISSDPVKLAGGVNLHVYGPNPTQWVDPDGLCSTALNKALGGSTGDRMQAHHLIPEEVWGNHAAFFKNIGMEGKRDVAANGVLMPANADKARQMKRKLYHCGSHRIYSAIVDRKVSAVENTYERSAKTAADAATARDEIAKLQLYGRGVMSAPLVGNNPRRLQ